MLFTRTAADEAQHKDISGGSRDEVNQRLSRLFIDHARSIALQSGLPLVVITSRNQVGDSFGERFSNAIQNVFERGFSSVISIGNDCLSLSPNDLREAGHALSSGNSAIGRSSSGGAYLIGLTKTEFQKVAFENLEWNSDRLYESLLEYLQKQSLGVFRLKRKTDVNNSFDLQLALKELSSHSALRSTIFSILRFFDFALPKDESINSSSFASLDSSRAPPSLLMC